MAEDQGQGEKTEEATQTRREDFRKRGQVAQTKELASALFILSALGGVYALSQFFLKQLLEMFNQSFGQTLVAAIRGGDLTPFIILAGTKIAFMLLPVLGIAFLISIGSTVVQIGYMQIEDAFSLDINKINPLEGLKRIFTLKNLIEGVKAAAKLCFICFISYLVLKSEIKQLPFLSNYSAEDIFSYLGKVTTKLLGSVGAAMLALAGFDYFFQRWDLEKKMMMTKQEVKEEHKSREGDPMIKARIRKIQREMANRRMMEKVPTADVIVTNPTHIAVALKYDNNHPAPQLVAKGADYIAEKIKNIAKENNIPIVENKPLARTIFKTMKLGQIIPRELFVAVAEVLSYVYKLKKKKVRR